MARKKSATGDPAPAEDTPPSLAPTPTPRIDIMAARAGAVREPIKVNNANLTELKNACDDAVRAMLSHEGVFTPIHTHTDVRLALGWAGVFVAAGTALYGWKVEFEKAKPLVWAGVILYVLLTGAQTLYAYFVERDTVYVGRRKTLAKRIETERIALAARTVPSRPDRPPRYALDVAYVRSSNGGKSLLGRGAGSAERAYSEFFDAEGTLDQERFESWVAALVEGVMEEK